MQKFGTKHKIKRRRRLIKNEQETETIRYLPTWRTVFYMFTLSYIFLVLGIVAYFYQRGKFHSIQTNKQLQPTLRTFTETNKQRSPCFGPITLPLNDDGSHYITNTLGLNSGDVIRIREYLNDFNKSSNGYPVLHIPDWVDRVLNAKKIVDKTSNGVSKPSYFLTAVLRVRLYEGDKARLSLAELKQWIHYQLWAGAEHVYICNHYLQDSERLEPGLLSYINIGVVTVYPWNNITAVPGTVSYLQDNSKNQDGCYNFVLQRHTLETVWQHNMDMDEYPFVPMDQCEGFLKRYLFQFEAGYRRDLISQVKLTNFLMKGVGDRTRDTTIDRINRIDRGESNPLVKPIYKLEFTSKVGTHGVTTTLGNTIRQSQGDIMMLHYWGSRTQNWGPDTEQTLRETNQFDAVRETIAVNVRHSLLVFADFGGFNSTTGP